MKKNSSALWAAFASLVLSAAPVMGESANFSVDLISPAKEYLYVDRSWERGADCLQVKISVMADVNGTEAKAYFYDGDAKLIYEAKMPSSQADLNGGTVKQVTQFQKGKKYEVFFAIPENIRSGAKKWKRAVVVFGKGGDFASKVYPKDDIAKFSFPEKTVKSASE